MFKLAVLISGNGSNLQAIIDKIHHPEHAEIVMVIADNHEAYGLTRAKNADINTTVIDYQSFPQRPDFHDKLLETVLSHQPDLIILAGYMRILNPTFVQTFPHKILNIHPSLLPKYPGTNTHQRVLEAGDETHGTSVHIVTESLDSGAIIAQATLELANSETASTIKAKVQKIEHILYPTVINWFINGRIDANKDTILFDKKTIRLQGIQFSQRELEESHDTDQI